MKTEARPEIAVLGLGNLMRTDDGVGVHAIRILLASGRLPPGVEAIEGGTLGLDLLPRLEGPTHLLAIDAVDFGAPPGALSRFAGQELLNLPAGKSVHLLGFSDLLNALYLLGRAPREVVLLGVQPESTGWSVTLSHPVAAVLDDLLATALAEIHGWLEGAPAGMALSGDANHS
ncbi:MAG: HyaD/HybD family hydrogenase maturation endopeptidase [Silvibacterium sp.]|nr:HyaD/HybD family hydrogenase maturation endopeptidase [Silvibacterium sp.]